MGLLDQVLGSVLGGAGGSGSALGGVLGSILGGQQTSGQPGNAGAGGQMGGLGGLVSAFEQAGLGHVVQSWISNGANLGVSPGQLQNVFGQGRVESMASHAGMAPGDFLSQLSQHLPNAVNAMTPDGRLPDEGSVSV